MTGHQSAVGRQMPNCQSPGGGPLGWQTGSQGAVGVQPRAPHSHGNAPERQTTTQNHCNTCERSVAMKTSNHYQEHVGQDGFHSECLHSNSLLVILSQ